MLGCLRRFGCLIVLIALCILAWPNRDKIMAWIHSKTAPASAAPTAPATAWELLTPEGADRAKETLQKLAARSGPVFANVSPGDGVSYIFEQLSQQIPPSAQGAAAAVIGDKLFIRASVKVSELGGKELLGPFAGVLGEREQIQFGGTIQVLKPGLAEYRVTDLSVRDFTLPHAAIPKLLRQIEHSPRPPGVDEDALPLVVPVHIGDVRIQNGKITLYKAVS